MLRPRENPRPPFGELRRREPRADHRLERAAVLHLGRIRGLHDAARELRQRVVACGGLAAPPRVHGRQRQRFAEQALREARHEAEHARRFEEARARRVREQHVAGAHGLQQPRHAEQRIGAQLERIEPRVVDAPQDPVHRFEPAQRLQEHVVVARGQVAALDEREAKVARQIRVLEIGRAVRPGRQQHDPRIPAGRAERLQALQQRTVRGREPLHAQPAKAAREQPRHDQPVFQQIAEPGRALRVLRDDPPLPVGAARQVEGDHVQPGVARHARAAHRAQVAGMPGDERGRQQPALQDRLRPVQVDHRRVEQPRALQHAALDRDPVLGRDDQRQQVERPRADRAVAGALFVQLVEQAVVAHAPVQRVRAAVEIGDAVAADRREEAAPRRRERGGAQAGGAAAQFVVAAGSRRRGERGGQLGRVRLRAGIEERGHRVGVGEIVGVKGRHDGVPSSEGDRPRARLHRQPAAAHAGDLPAS
ncbi:hypothetical protein FEQ02_03603 [Burkholderia pseudomultivorans]|nr:hypothetical protein [Burkholderia pseudomultivorans]